ncbi:SMI1/KNR4 family protein [Streptomyces sp. NPDC048680]|uniref:SMI1/KNR4 family protein n=1 Tax=Streptomyces sp. NPDC048680 TaxID=3155492 RepID=UPI0034424564
MSVEIVPRGTLSEAALRELEVLLGFPFPAEYRSWLARTNGAHLPLGAELAGFEYGVEDDLYGHETGENAHSELFHAFSVGRGGLSKAFLPIMRLSTGVITIRVAEPRVGSIWHHGESDFTEDGRYILDIVPTDEDAEEVADTFAEFLEMWEIGEDSPDLDLEPESGGAVNARSNILLRDGADPSMTETRSAADGSPSSEYAGQIVQFPSSPRSRSYPDGLYVDLYGFPDFLPYARSVIETGPVAPDLGIDEARVTDVLAANLATATSGDPLYAGAEGMATPSGWTWHHDPHERRFMLVPVEVKNAVRHHGGVAAMRVNRDRTGLRSPVEQPRNLVTLEPGQRLTDGDLAHLENKYLRFRLPQEYRALMIEGGGGRPVRPAVHMDHGFVLDQQFFNLYVEGNPYDLLDVAMRFVDRFTGDLLTIAWVQGGALVMATKGLDAGSIWYWDNDDRRCTQRHDQPQENAELLSPVADNLSDLFSHTLVEVPARLNEIARNSIAEGHFRQVAPDNAGTALPPELRR